MYGNGYPMDICLSRIHHCPPVQPSFTALGNRKKTSLLSSFCSVTVKWDLLQHHCCCELELTTQGQGPTRPAVQEHRRHSGAEGPQTHSPSLHLQTHLHGSPGSKENQCQILKILENRQENWRNQSTPWGKCLLGGTAWEKLLP